MRTDNLSHQIGFGPTAERISATYRLTADDARKDPAAVDAMRRNLESESEDLLEITIMRLGVRVKDCGSFDRIAQIFTHAESGLLLSASAFALRSLAVCGQQFAGHAKSLISSKLASTEDPSLASIYKEQLAYLEASPTR